MGANQSQQQGQQEKRRIRKRDYLIGMCISQLAPKESNESSKLRSLSENMKSQSLDILTKMSEREMYNNPIKFLQYFLTFLTIRECFQLKLVNKKLKFMVEMSSNIYSNFLSQFYLRKLQLRQFVEYGLHQRFLSVYYTQLQSIEINQDESWIRIYLSFQRSIQQMRIIEEEIQKIFNIEYPLVDKILETGRNPLMPVPLLTDDILKQSTTSWFQLELAQRTTDFTAVEKVPQLDELTEKIYQYSLRQFDVTNMKHTQILFELRWIVIDNFLKDPFVLDSDNIPLLFRFLLLIFHFIYQRCLFSRNVLIITKTEKNPAMFLNMYTILWESYVGTMWSLNRALKKIFKKIDLIFDEYFTTYFPKITFTSALARLWSQIVIKGTKNQQLDSIENELFASFDVLLEQKRVILQQFYMKDHWTKEQQVFGNKLYNDDYFNYCPSAVNCLLNKFTSNILDLSLHEQSINWIGHSNVKVGSLYGKLVEIVIKQANLIYGKASQQLSTDYNVFKNYILADSKYMQEILNQWTVQVCLLPKGIEYLYEKVKINLRQYVLSCQLNQYKSESTYNNFEENILESKIIGQNVQQLQLNDPDEIVQHVDGFDQFLENLICEILREEKIQQNEQIASQNLQQIPQQQSEINQPSLYQFQCGKQQSILESDYNKLRMLSTFTSYNPVSQITQLNSVYSQQILSSYKSCQNINQIKNIKAKLEHNQWVVYLKDIYNIEYENKIKIEKRNNQIQMRNTIRKIPQDLEEQLNSNAEFTKVWSIEDTMLQYVSKNTIDQLQARNPERNFSEMKVGEGLLASYFIQQQI
ncbi:unnamed protein product [Paramecium sonneborni]|uniref:F-box domain-containing protein n=1 Tax=Paramecium sonneborni TaxID=65129 RepID=A0A8S1PB35_9CILI|nr:unnamed protein product [Paramecium sonneborni]